MRNYPDFMVIGFGKCGTTTLFEHLRRHPQIFIPKMGNCPFVANDTRRTYMQRYFPKDYKGKIVGVVTPSWINYPDLFYEWFMEYPKTIIITRDKTERAKSLWRMKFDSGDETRHYTYCMKKYLELSDYDKQLRKWNFEYMQVYKTTLEKLAKDPGKVIDEIHEFLGVNPYRAKSLGRKYNTGKDKISPLMKYLRKSFIRHLFTKSFKRKIWRILEQ